MEFTEFILDGGRIIDPAQALDTVGALHIKEGRVAGFAADAAQLPDCRRYDVSGLIVCPGLIDVHVHLREPGQSHKETIETGCRAAVAGGFTSICCMPNTSPPIDNVETLEWVRHRAEAVGLCHVYVVAAITIGRQGRELVDFAALTRAGAVAFSDDGDGIEDDDLMRRALRDASAVDRVIMQHPEYHQISQRGVMHLGPVSKQLNLTGYDPRGEEAMIERDISLLMPRGARLHVQHVSTAGGVQLIREAKARGLAITAEASPHHLLLTDEEVPDPKGRPNPNRKMNPPLRSRSDLAAVVAGVRDGTLDCIATDHAPHTAEEKSADFAAAPLGVVGLETALPCAAQALLEEGLFDWPQLIDRMTTSPASALHVPGGTIATGQRADITIINPDAAWTVDPEKLRSRSKNTPFAGWTVKGRAYATIVAGSFAYIDADAEDRFSAK